VFLEEGGVFDCKDESEVALEPDFSFVEHICHVLEVFLGYCLALLPGSHIVVFVDVLKCDLGSLRGALPYIVSRSCAHGDRPGVVALQSGSSESRLSERGEEVTRPTVSSS